MTNQFNREFTGGRGMRKYEFGGRRGCCRFSEIIEACCLEEAAIKAEEWCEEHDAEYQYCILA